ncbi:glutamate synthase subunit beta [Flexithrix dorotheae]|uniref:glutamate synthase subunit beta n=1 Tax=Flexithrix dorotheae TaxID=70993 RepID=UPI00037747B9|nr:glutamate synthase subunit beta [Flexithrix dorotheae]
MYEFTKIERIDPIIKPTNERVQNFEEINELYTEEEAGVQASRCIQCGNPYCSATGCPLSNNIPQWLKFIAEKDLELAFQISNETSPFPEILGRICPQDRLCEGACTLNENNDGQMHSHGAISIGSIEVSISERGFNKGFKPEFPGITTDKKVAIIGSGPAGLSCATFLLRAGVKPVVYESADQAGGLLTYGIPGFKLEKESVKRRVDLLVEAGMELHLNTQIGKDISFEEIHKTHEAVFLGIGATEGKVLDYDSYNSNNVFMAVPFLTNIQKKIEELPFDKKFDVKGKNVMVIGGGDTAMDCVRTSVREGAEKVHCVYRRGEADMPGSRKEVKSAKEEGVEFLFFNSPKSFVADDKGMITGMKLIQTELIPGKDGGRGRIIELDGSEQIMHADVIILALGFNNQKVEFLEKNGIELNDWGAIKVDENQQTTKEGVYAGGDTTRGADLVVTAALDGREAAYKILEKIFDEEI